MDKFIEKIKIKIKSKMIIAIDGPASSGKGTVAKKLAEYCSLPYLNTGGLYRSVGFEAMNTGINKEDINALIEIAKKAKLDNLDSPELYTEQVGVWASVVAKIPEIRKILFQYQVDFANQEVGAVLDGRDIGTVICPNADVKLFVTASVEVRADRRYKELQNKGKDVQYDEILDKVKARDKRDIERKDSPLKPADDAIILDTSSMSKEEVFNKAVEAVKSKIKA